jgi:hypothetical protein
MQTGQVTKSRSKPRNILRGIIPTADTFDTPPTNLENITDGNITTVTGVGTKNMEGGGTYGQIIFDLKTNKYITISGHVGLYSSAGTTYVYVDTKKDGDADFKTNITPLLSITSTTQLDKDLIDMSFYTRYVRLRFYVTASSTANAVIYYILCHEKGF